MKSQHIGPTVLCNMGQGPGGICTSGKARANEGRQVIYIGRTRVQEGEQVGEVMTHSDQHVLTMVGHMGRSCQARW